MKLAVTVPALMFALSLTACGTTEDAPRGGPAHVAATKNPGPTVASAKAVAATPPAAPSGAFTPSGSSLKMPTPALAAGAATATATRSQNEAPGSVQPASPTDDKLEVRRLLLASRVVDREPELALAPRVNEPLLAFVEAKNDASTEERLIVTFEHESGTKVGFVELRVPAGANRYRTWARTRNLKEAGNWTVVVRKAGGAELGRAAFVVTQG